MRLYQPIISDFFDPREINSLHPAIRIEVTDTSQIVVKMKIADCRSTIKKRPQSSEH